MPAPSVMVEISQTEPLGTQVWVDESAYVRADLGLTMSAGRADEEASVSPGRLSLTLDNTSGRFTFGEPNAAGCTRRPGQRVRVTVGGVPRFNGTVDGWPVSWDASRTPLVQLGASDRMKELSVAGPTAGGLWDAARLVGADYVVPVDDVDAKVRAWDAARESVLYEERQGLPGLDPTAPLSWRPAFTAGPAPDGGMVASVSGGNSYQQWWFGLSDGTTTAGTLLSFWVRYEVESGDRFGYVSMDTLLHSGAWRRLAVVMGPRPEHRVWLALLTSPLDISVVDWEILGPDVSGGAWHHVAVTTAAGAWTLWVDGVSFGTYGALGNGLYPVEAGSRGRIYPSEWDIWHGTFAHFVCCRSGTVADVAVLNGAGAGMPSERTGQRIARAMEALGVASSDMVLDSGDATASRMSVGQVAPGAMAVAAAAAERGVLFADQSGRFVFHSRKHRGGATAALVVDATDIGEDFRLDVDAEELVTTQRYDRVVAGSVVEVDTRSSAAARAAYGRRLGTAIQVPLDGGPEWLAVVGDDFAARSVVRPRSPQLTLDLLTLPWAGLLPGGATPGDAVYPGGGSMDIGLGDLVRVTGIPDGAGATECHLFVEGWTESISTTAWELKLSTSPGWLGDAGEFDTALFDAAIFAA